MHERLLQKFDKLEVRRLAFQERVSYLPDAEQIVRKNGAFNGLEVLFHMSLVEGATNDALDATPLGKYDGKMAKPSFLYAKVIERMRSGQSAPAPAAFTPKWVPSLEEAIKAWEKERERLHKHLEIARINEAWVKRPWLGLLSADHILDLMDAHITYHDKRL
jgi:hypothetical protein